MIPAYPEDDLWEELVELGSTLHWTLDDLLDLAHRDRLLVLETLEARRRREREGQRHG